MRATRFFARLPLALATAALASLAFASVGFAQSSSSGSGPYVVRVESPAAGAQVWGNIGFSGLAVDCGSQQPATRVSIYDGPTAQYRHLGDAAVNILRERDDACLNQAGTGSIGWNLVLDRRRLTPGQHTLTFVAHFPNGATSTVTHSLYVQPTVVGSQYGHYGSGPVVWYNGAYWVNGTYMGPNYVPPVYYANQCVSIAANGTCLAYQNVTTPYLHHGVRGYTTCTAYPTYRCNYTFNNGGIGVKR